MKVQMITLAAIAAASLSAQGVAQQGEQTLERALADLNNGLTAQAGTSDVSGDARLRNLYTSADSKDIDARTRLNFSFNVNENAGAVVSFLGYEAWGSQASGDFESRMNEAYYWANDLFGDGGTTTLGRKHFTLGSGRILGSDDWDQAPSLQTGLWYSHEMGGANFEAFFLNSQDDAGAGGGAVPSSDSFGFSFDWSVGDISLRPYVLSSQDNGFALADGWYLGAELSGSLAGFGWSAEWAQMDEIGAGVGGGSALVANTTIAFDALTALPGVDDGSLMLQISSADDDFSPVAPVYHGTAGLRDALGRNGIWTSGTDTMSAHLGFSPGEAWNGKISWYSVDTAADSMTEWDVQVGTTLAGAVDLWLGYSDCESDAGLADDSSLWAVIGMNF